jgi:hypothetical protein
VAVLSRRVGVATLCCSPPGFSSQSLLAAAVAPRKGAHGWLQGLMCACPRCPHLTLVAAAQGATGRRQAPRAGSKRTVAVAEAEDSSKFVPVLKPEELPKGACVPVLRGLLLTAPPHRCFRLRFQPVGS